MSVKVYLNLGSNVNPAWTASIARSNDGATWETFTAEGLIVTPVISGGTASAMNPSGTDYRVSITSISGELVLQFTCGNVVNQAGWTNTLVGLKQAISDITTWIAQATGMSPLNPPLTQDHELYLVRDDAGDFFLAQYVWDEGTSSYTVSYLNPDGTPAVPVPPVVFAEGGLTTTPAVIEATVNGLTQGAVQSVTLWFRGTGGTLDGVAVPDGGIFTFRPNGERDIVAPIAYTVPTAGESRIIITYNS